jgi:glycosyltransferase involved in cell wall biosynthesis
VVIGSGQEETRLRMRAGPETTFLGWQSDLVLRDHLRRCRALLFPGEEDFGIVPVEAQACGTPVIAFGRGGATETVVPLGGRQEPTGVWFNDQTAESLIDAIQQYETHSGDLVSAVLRRQALHFNHRHFADELFAYLDGVLDPSALPIRRAA